MTLPVPEPGLVIAYSYLWAKEHQTGSEEGRKTRPCAIVAARRLINGHHVVTVIPITHTPPTHLLDALELPAAIKAHLGLDADRSWAVITETNDFLWPGPDLRPITGGTASRFHYGILPPRFFAALRDRILATHALRRVVRTE